jgi:hypothetical protein
MGGQMTLSMRLPTGDVSHYSIWTNNLPAMMQDPTFMNMGPGFDEFIASVKPGNVWPQPEKLRQYRHGEYGAVLVDFASKVVTSRQGYCNPEMGLLDLESDRRWLKELINKGADLTLSVHSLGGGSVAIDPTVQQAVFKAAVSGTYKEYLKVVEPLQASHANGLFEVREARKGWAFNHKNTHPKNDKEAARALAAVRQSWKAKIIPIGQEPKPWDSLACERCCICRTKTRWWTKLPDRTPGGQVALCPGCAVTTTPESIPTKTAWCDKERELNPDPWRSPWAFTGLKA